MNKYHKRYENITDKSYEWYLDWLRRKGFTKK
jgi:hypothetical protein